MFEFFFSYPLRHYQEATLAFDSPIPQRIIVALAVVVFVLLLASMIKACRSLSWWRIGVLSVLQFGVFLVLLAMFTQPVLVTERLLNQENDILYVLDTSQSMAYGEAGNPRIEQALSAFGSEPLQEIKQNYSVLHYIFADKEQRVDDFSDLPAPVAASNLGESLISVLQQASTRSIGAIVLATDGVDTQSNSGVLSADQLAEISDYGVPIHAVGFGRTTIAEDIEVASLQMPSTVLPNTLVKADISIRHDAAGVARIKVYDGDRFISSQEIALTVPESVADNQVSTTSNASIEFDAGTQGFKDIQFVVDSIEGERNLTNNRVSQLLEVRNGQYQVLYIDGEPRWEYKFIRRALESDSTLDLHTLLWVSDNKFYRQGIETPSQLADGFPSSKEELFSYDALVIGSVAAPRFNIDQQQMIFDFVNERGGSLIMLGGRYGLADGGWGNSQVGQLLPARLKDIQNSFIREPAQAQLTSFGINATMLKFTENEDENLELWQSLPNISDYQQLGTLRPAASTLLSMDNGAPLLVSQPYGKGKASIFATAASWRWQMNLPADDDRHHRFWRQLVRSHVVDTRQRFDLNAQVNNDKVELLAEIADPNFATMNDVRITAIVSKEITSTDAEQRSAQTVELKPVAGESGIYRTELPLSDSGVFYVDAVASQNGELLDSARLAFDMPENQAEFFNIRQNKAQLERLAAVTGGQYWQASNLTDLPSAIAQSKAGITEQQRDPLWSIPFAFFLLLLLKVSEWLLRRQWGKI